MSNNSENNHIPGVALPIDQHIKLLREKVDFVMETAETNKASGESTLAWRSLQMGKAWLGKALESLGTSPNPYPASDTAKGIPPTADVNKAKDIPLAPKDPDGYTQYLNKTRVEVQDLINQVAYFKNSNSNSFNEAIANSFNHLTEAKLWFGYELGRVKESVSQSHK